MASRYDQPTNEPDYDRYEPKPVDDIDVPDFDAPEPLIDPREHAAQTALSGLHELELLVLHCADVETAQFLKKLTRQLWNVADRVDLKASLKIDELMERRR